MSKEMAALPRLVSPNDPKIYLELLWTATKYPHSVWWMPSSNIATSLVDKSLHINLYKAYNLPLGHPWFKQNSWYLLEDKYLSVTSDGDYATIPSGHDVHIYKLTKGWFL